MSDSCQRQRTGFPSLIGPPHVVGCCASIRRLCPTPVQLPLQRRVTSDTRLESSVNSEQAMVPPQPVSNGRTTIHTLPIELITAIFVLGSESDDPYVDSPFLLKTSQEYEPAPSSNFQVLVSQVCRDWRKIATEKQSLWTTLHFRHPSHIPRAKVFLSRAGTFKLFNIFINTVSAKEHTEGLNLFNDELDEIFQIIIPHIQRWRAFHLKIADNLCKGTARLYLSTCGGAPNLETLQLYHFENYKTPAQLLLATYRPPVIIFGNNLPKVKNISLIGVNLGWDNCPFLSNLNNLELALHSEDVRPNYKSWAKILQSSTKMKTMSLHYSGPKPFAFGDTGQPWPSREHRIRLQFLRELNLTDLDAKYLCDLMERMDLPNLRKLTLELSDQDYSPFITLLIGPSTHPTDVSAALLSSSSDTFHPNATQDLPPSNPPITSLAKLQALTIRDLSCSLTSWVALLRSLEGLRTLEADFSRLDDGFWMAFTGEVEHMINTPVPSETMKRQPTLVLPLLESFKLTGVSGRDIITALAYRHKHHCRTSLFSQEWTIGWSTRRRNKDRYLDALINRGFWVPVEGSETGKVVIKNYHDEEEESSDFDGESSEDDTDEFEDAGSSESGDVS